MEVGGAFLTLGKALLQRVTEHLKRSRCSYSEFQHAAPPPSLLRDPLRLGEIHEADPPPPPHLAVKQLAGPRPGAAQCPLLPPGGWASPPRTHRAWAAVHPQPGFCDLSSSCQNPHMWSMQGMLQRLLWAPAPRLCAGAWGARASECQKHTPSQAKITHPGP